MEKRTAAEMMQAVNRYYWSRHGSGYALVTEITASMNEIDPSLGNKWRDRRRIDALVAVGGTLTAIEIKVSRQDFLRETDEKRAPWRALTHRFLYVAPAGIIKPEEVPKGCGLLEVPDRALYAVQVVRPRLNKEPAPLPFAVVQRLMYKANERSSG